MSRDPWPTVRATRVWLGLALAAGTAVVLWSEFSGRLRILTLLTAWTS